ncbi:MAG: 4a-hydroxytetrahydrobiopterin dehydratase [Armatimonadetes bacterium]|nr:4a-hydroxytetrahydrobiopterin dehydratase [Armatimonadota bacterium]NOG39029.1 4a-hydroxytetrahydrobiopterin dehydratase [Armatimonadota bacterium]GIK33024.1 MAG: putative pterin-4-alpha-carbinolamine dehydratase [Armatimonadota bacterium]HQU19852.1 4a-hydroxytetrahydrobiopterin dehydratase [Fimbriimonadaceae bacterium]
MSALPRKKLAEEEISAELRDFEGWAVEDGKLAKEIPFEKYLDGAAFAFEVAKIAEEMDHHPDLMIGYCRVKVAVNTHDVGGISAWDFELARRIDVLRA